MTKQNYAFISYNHRDVKMAKWLHRKLESYKLPTEIHNEFEDSRYLRPVFRDQEDLNAGVLGDELRKHLENSKYLIVICSPNSARSEWVSNEVRTFIEWGRLEHIIPFIVDGTPGCGDERECFPQSLRDYIKNHPDRELLGISVEEVGREKAFVRVVSRMLDVSFDELWKRHERARRRRLMAWAVGTPVAALLLYWLAVPISVTIDISDARHRLPLPDDAVLVVNGAEYPLVHLDTSIMVKAVPGYYRGHKLPVRFSATYYTAKDCSVILGYGVGSTYRLALERDSTFAVFAGTVVGDDGDPIAAATVNIGNVQTQTDNHGRFYVVFPTEEQTTEKPISIQKQGKRGIARQDECPDNNLKYVIHELPSHY